MGGFLSLLWFSVMVSLMGKGLGERWPDLEITSIEFQTSMLEQSQGQKIRAKFCWDCRQWKKNISEGLYAYLQLSALSYSKAVFQAVRPPSAADLFGASYASGSKALWMFDHSRESRASGDHLPNMDISCGEQVLTMLRKDCAAFSLTGESLTAI